VVAGVELDPSRPGYRHVLFRPTPGGDLTHARATLRSLHGEIRSGWELDGETMWISVTLPPNTSGTVRLPGAVAGDVLEDGRPLAQAEGVSEIRQLPTACEVSVVAGDYSFTYPATTRR
jgi:alpha-L-rhamnosidase